MERYFVGCDKKGNEPYNTNNNKSTERKEITGLTRITKKRLKELCKKDKLYQTPALNDVLYLHYQGIDCIECLEEYTGLKCLWLESNAISEIQGLDNQKQLKCLFLQSNLIKRIENLENCPELDTLNLASNHIRKIENCGFDVLPVLSTLNLSSNFLKDFDGLKDLENCKTLSVLDLSNNRIEDILVVKIFAKMPQLRVLVLQGNPVVSKLPQYRKTLILECKELTYLDSRPVFPKDRACAEAWKTGGYEGERKENARWNRMERKKIRDSVNATIRMRNKHKPPDQQDALFNSSDSEEDMAEAKRKRQAEVDAGINMELGIWEEVVNEDSKSETSSDMNISSSTSGLSTTDSNANVSADSKSMELNANLDKEEKKIANNSPDTKAQVLEIARDGNMGEILKVVNTNPTEPKQSETKEVIVGLKRVFIEEISTDFGGAENEVTEIASSVVERLLDNEIIPAVMEKAGQLDRRLSANNLSDSDDAIKDEYNATVDAICKITMNDLSMPSPKKRIKLQIEVDEILAEAEAEENLELLEQIIVVNEKEVERVCTKADDHVSIKEKTLEQIKYEKECEEVNQKVVDDFEELSTHMDNFIEEMQMSNDRLNGEEAKDASFDQQQSETESTESSHTELQVRRTNLELLQSAPPPEKYMATIMEHVAHVEGLVIFESPMTTDGELICERAGEEGSSSSGSDVPPEASSAQKVDISNPLTPNLDAIRNDVPGDHADIPTLFTDTQHEDDCPEKADSGNEKNTTSTAVDCNLSQDKANTSYEREERELRQLLQKLEDENEQLYNLNNAYRRVLEEDIREEIKYHDKESGENSEGICEEIIKDLLNDMTIMEQKTPTKPKSFEFGVIESDEEYSYSDPPKPPETPVRTIREVLGSFNELLQEIARKNREEEERKERESTEALRRKHASTEAEKVTSLHNLLNSPNLRDFNGDTNESLDQQIAAEKQRESVRVRKLVHRVYAQKDKYNDTLEVVDGKLVVVKKGTGEIEDLPASKLNYSDSEDTDAYESANSDNEAGTESTRLWDAKVRREESVGGFKLPYRPTERISAMKLIQKANALKEKEDAEREAEVEDEENEKFYSLEPTKPVTYCNIDEEFIEKLDFKNAVHAKEDEIEEEMVECARSYTELKQIVKENKEELNLTDDENVMLQNMLGRAEIIGEDEAKQRADPLTVEENELLHKMVQRTKEKEKEKQEAHRLEAEARELNVKPTLSKQTLKIIEFNNNNNSNTNNGDGDNGERAGNFMNIKQLNAKFPIPSAFRDMLDDYDLGTMPPHLEAAEPELTVLYSKADKKDEMDRTETELLRCGNYENPLQLSRGGIVLAAYKGDDEEEFKELDTSYDDALPASENELAREIVVEEQREVGVTKMDVTTSIAKDSDIVPEEKSARLRDVAASVLKFDGSNYEDYGIDKETARGVVEYEKMLNFGYEEEEEFVDAPMQEDELVKIVTEALQNDRIKEERKDMVGVVETMQGSENSYREFRVFETKQGGLQAESTESKVEQYFEISDVDIEQNERNVEKQETTQDEFAERKEAKTVEHLDMPENADSKMYASHLKKLTEENDTELESIGNPSQCNAEDKNLVDEVEFQDLSEEYKDFPVVGSSPAETIGAADLVTEPKVVEEDTNSSKAATNFPGSTTTLTSAELSHKRSHTELEKQSSLQNLLKSPILKQFNDDTSESLDAEIQAAKATDFDVIECSLQVIGDNDEVVNEISVNAEITYST